MHLLECTWGRLVDVHALDARGEVDPVPAFRDLLINETVQSDALNYRLETSAITQATRLVILRPRGEPRPGEVGFDELLKRARDGLAPLVPKPDSGTGPGPLSLVARNACLSLRFDDLLLDDFDARLVLEDMVRVRTGYPPEEPFGTRMFFDPNHGGITGGEFHSTRVLIDLAVTEQEVAASEFPLVVNTLGLPTSAVEDERPNGTLHLPTRTDPGTGLFRVLSNLNGSPLDASGNGPVDLGSPTRDLQRAFRSGRADDANAGFLLDLNPPELVGTFPLQITSASAWPGDATGLDLRVDFLFPGVCRRAPRALDIVQSGEHFLEVVDAAAAPSFDGEVRDVHLRLVGEAPLPTPALVVGGATFQSTYSPGVPIPFACWVTVQPLPGMPPEGDIASSSVFSAHFSEPMSPGSVDPFETMRLARGNSGSPLLATSVVVSETFGSPDLRTFFLRPRLPLAQGIGGEYHLDLVSGSNGLMDLAGNQIVGVPGGIDFRLDPEANAPENGAVVMRFESTDELEPIGLPDLRGQFFYDFAAGSIRGRDPTIESFPADQTQPVPSIMIPFGPGVQTPLSGLGSKLQYVWRYCDLGWTVEDETKHNLDVIGISWTPVGGTILNDFYPRFELRLSHSRRLPDEFRVFTGTEFPCSGLGAGNNVCPPCATNVPFENNILLDPRSPQKAVHDRDLGYRVEARDLYLGQSGHLLLPYPLNRGGGPLTTFTWRDTAVLARGGEEGGGIPMKIETASPLSLVPGPPGRIALGGLVPAWGLPLLVEVRCFPSTTALGLNPVEIYLAQNAQALPNFRAYSTGGTNESGVAVQVDPDLSVLPEGGYNPGSRPPGKPTLFQADNSFYTGELTTIVRVSRAHTIWIDIGTDGAEFLPPVVSPPASDQPGNSRIELEFRGADGFQGPRAADAFDAREIDPMGDLAPGVVQFHGDALWHASPAELDGARFLQIRISFVNDIRALVSPRLGAIGLAFTRP